MANDPEHDKLDALTARIHQAEEGPKAKMPLDTVIPIKVSRIGFDFMSAVLGCAFLGWLVDRTLNTKPWGLIGLVLVGFGIGMMNMWRALASQKSE